MEGKPYVCVPYSSSIAGFACLALCCLFSSINDTYYKFELHDSYWRRLLFSLGIHTKDSGMEQSLCCGLLGLPQQPCRYEERLFVCCHELKIALELLYIVIASYRCI